MNYVNHVGLKKVRIYVKIDNRKYFTLLFLMQEEKIMLNVFVKKSAEELHIKLSDGRMMLLEDLVSDYERLLKGENPKEDPLKESITSKLKVGEWFRIDRDVIAKNQEKIRRVCNEARDVGKAYWERFEESNKIADENPDQYPRLIETYIFKHDWKYKTEQEMRDMCEDIGDGECDEVICDLELQMRICNGESAHVLFEEADKLPRVRVIQLRNGGTGYFGGGADRNDYSPPADLYRYSFNPNSKKYRDTPYAFRRVLS